MNDEPFEIVHGSGNVFRDFSYPDADVRQTPIDRWTHPVPERASARNIARKVERAHARLRGGHGSVPW